MKVREDLGKIEFGLYIFPKQDFFSNRKSRQINLQTHLEIYKKKH